jgi:hypothetical protein
VSEVAACRLARLIAIVEDRKLFQGALRESREMRQWVLEAEHLLSADFLPEGEAVTTARVAQHFETWLLGLAHKLHDGLLSQTQQPCLHQFLQVLSNQRTHLIQWYDQADFPRTNNDMERRLRAIKTRSRRGSFRKNGNSYLLHDGRYVAFFDWWQQDETRSCQFLYQVAQFNRADWRKLRKACKAARSSQLGRFRFLHKRPTYLASLEARWETAVPTSLLP